MVVFLDVLEANYTDGYTTPDTALEIATVQDLVDLATIY